jgi:hypothetical protein
VLRILATSVAGGQSFLITNGTGARGNGAKEVTDDIEVVYDAVVQRAPYINAPQPVWIPHPLNYYQQSGSFPLAVEYTFADSAAGEGECFRFWKQLQTTVPVLANLEITAGSAAGTILGVKLRPLRVRTIGTVAVRVTYPVSFGLILSSLS